jgi:transcriptional regulator with XRE-family HTH domain
MKNAYVGIGKYLSEQRRASGLTQREVSTALGYTTAQFVSNWERGVSLPAPAVLADLAPLLGVSKRALCDRWTQEKLDYEKKKITRNLKKGS